jgi:tetratricopeptide (TPR) repeat protein
VLTPARAAAAAVVLLAAGGGSYWWMARPVDRIPVAIAPVANHTGEPALDDYRLAMTAALVDELSESPNIRVAPYVRVLEMLRRFISGAGDISSRDAIQAISTQSGAHFVVVPALAYRDGAWLALAEIRNVGTLETEAVTSSLPKETAYRLIVSLAAGIQEHFKVSWPRGSPAGRSPGSRFRTLDAARAFEEGLNNYEQMEYSAALAALRRAAAEDPERAIAHAWLSRVLFLMGQGSEAQAAGRRASQLLSADTPRADALFASATLAESQADVAAAEARYRELTAFERDSAMAQAELADFLKRQYRDQEAVEAYHEVLRVDVGHIRPHVELCQLYTRLNDHPLAEQQAQAALEGYRAAGDRAGQAQALLCLGEVQRVEQGTHLAEARRNIESARDIFESLGHQYSLSRVYQYLGLIAASERNYRAAIESWEEALSRSRQMGNRVLEGTLLMNVGLAHLRLGQRRQALDYFGESRDFYEQIGEARRAAEAEVNLAALLVDHGGEQSEVLRHVSNAQSTFRKLGQVDFDLAAMEIAATSHRYAGQLVESLRQLNQALNMAKERQLRNRIESVSVNIAQSQFLLNEYEAARTLLEEVVASDAGRDDFEAHIILGRVYVRLGNFEGARQYLGPALANTEAGGQMTPSAIAHAASGELAYESGRLQEARGHFDKAAAFWTEDLPDAASVEARCYEGLLDALTGKIPAARRIVELSTEQARKMGRLYLEARCRLALARIHFTERRYSQAVAALDELAPGGDRTIGPELGAEVHYWRGRAMAARGDRVAAESEIALARKLAQELRASLPEQHRDGFVSRTTIRPLVE